MNKALSKRSKRAARAPPRRRGEALRKLYEGGSFQLLSGRGVFLFPPTTLKLFVSFFENTLA